MTDEQRRKRIHDIVYSCDSREELAGRIVGLESLIKSLLMFGSDTCTACPVSYGSCKREDDCIFMKCLKREARELGIEV